MRRNSLSKPDHTGASTSSNVSQSLLDIADYKVGWIFSMRPFITIIKVKTSKIMENPKYATIIQIFGIEYRKA
jgi:hypothetical protein